MATSSLPATVTQPLYDDGDASHVLMYHPACLFPDRRPAAGSWVLMTRAEFGNLNAEVPAYDVDDSMMNPLPVDAPSGQLAQWVTRRVGYRVALTFHMIRVRVPLRPWQDTPIYWVTRG